MEILAIYSVLILFIVKMDSPEILRFSLKPFLKFLLIIIALTGLRLWAFVDMPMPIYKSLPNIESLLLVFWEDVFFVLPLLIMKKYQVEGDKLHKVMFWIVMAISSIFFASGHLYISTEWATILLAYVPLMYSIARKSGLTNVMLGHVIYDVATVLTATYGWSLMNV